MAQETAAVEGAVARALRDSLTTLQRNAEELRQAVDDVVAACGSSKPTNVLPPMLRAHTAAASLASALDVLGRFIATSLQPLPRTPFEQALASGLGVAEPETSGVPPPATSAPGAVPAVEAGRAAVEPPPRPFAEVIEPVPMPEAAMLPEVPVEELPEFLPEVAVEPIPDSVAEPAPVQARDPAGVAVPGFDVSSLPFEARELHRRANRYAKVTMQDIKMYKGEQVRLGQQQGDLCARLRDDIEKARREYDRRFGPILDHPVDYFYDWMVRILADGNPEKLGDYPYPSPVQRR